MSTFGRLSPNLQQAIVARLGWSSLRPVQELAGEALLDGKNAIVLAPTAGGKTEAAFFPALSTLVEQPPTGVGIVYVAPIKALLNNQADRLGLYTEMVGLKHFVWHGDTPTNERDHFRREPTDLLMTTPESLEVMLVSPRMDAGALFHDLRFVVVDEVHALAGSDRGAHLMSVLERLARLSKHDVQRVGLSATVGNPVEILSWLQGTSARSARGEKSLFFCQSRAVTESVAQHMRHLGTQVFVHHSAVSKEERLTAEERFHHGSDACIVCTSTLELGIDVGDLDRVFQSEAPSTVSSFLQRMGRTGRREGQAANTTFFCETTDGVLQAIALVKLAKAGWVESVEVNPRAWPVLVHQLLTMALAADGVPKEEAWDHLSKVPDFAGISREEFDRLVAYLVEDQSLRLASGRLVLGPKVERLFGRRNFLELYSVFTSPESYTVQTMAGQPLGTLSQEFVDRLSDGVSCFLLGGRPWVVMRLQHGDRRVLVEPAPRGRQPTWGGHLPHFLGYEVCQKMLEILVSEQPYPYLHEEAAEVLEARRTDFAGMLRPGIGGVEKDGNEIRWWTFAGGRINGTLRHAIEALRGWKVVPDNTVVRVRAEGLRWEEFRAVQETLRDATFWEDEKLWQEIAGGLPGYRLSKFQPLLPDWVEREMLTAYLLDVEGARRVAGA